MTALPPFAVSVVIPAFNAAATIATTLDSIVRQTDSGWEAIVVDDGSSDGTVSVVEAYAARDPRIRLLDRPNVGRSAARNLGIEQARYDWILFLDADDWVDGALVQSVRERLELDPDLDVVHYGWTRLWSDGRIIDHGIAAAERDLFSALATHCTFMIHAAVARRALIVRAGCFDRTLFAAEDWLLWQRIARLGARFGRVDARLAFRRYTPGCLNRDLDRMTQAWLQVFRIGHGPDPALPLEEQVTHRLGATDDSRRRGSVVLVCRLAGTFASAGRDPFDVAESVPDDGVVTNPTDLAVSLSESLSPAVGAEGSWAEMWSRVGSMLAPFLDALELKLRCPQLARTVTQRVERAVALRAASAGGTSGMRAARSSPSWAGTPFFGSGTKASSSAATV